MSRRPLARIVRALSFVLGIALIAAVGPAGTEMASATGTGIIRGTIYNDTEDNGIQSWEVWPELNATVYLDADDDGVFDPGELYRETRAHGQYDFENLDPGTYSVRISVSSPAKLTHPGRVTVTSGQDGRYDGAVFYTASVSGTMFHDIDGNGVLSAPDVGERGRAIIDQDRDGVFSTNDFVADAALDGSYKFPSIPDGSYLAGFNVWSEGVAVLTPTTMTVHVANGKSVTDANTIVDYKGKISGRLYIDIDHDHTYDVGEGIPGVDVSLLRYNVNGELETYPTADDGTFSFPSVGDNSYMCVYIIDRENPTDYSNVYCASDRVKNGLNLVVDIVIDVPDVAGYRVATAGGNVFNYGSATNYGSMAGKSLNAPIISMASLPGGSGYWLLARDGGVFTFGGAKFYGSTGGMRLNAPIVAMAVAPDGEGYWLVASDGGVFAFGSAKFHGSMGGKSLNKPIVGMSADSYGDGYWLVASDGGIFAFDAVFAGSAGSLTLNKPIVGMTPDPDGEGYWLVASDGGIFSYRAPFFSSAGSIRLNSPIAGVASSPIGDGYYLLASDGGIFSYPSERPFFGSPAGSRLSTAAVGISVF